MGLEILGRPDWESTQPTSIEKGLLNGSYKVWLMPCEKIQQKMCAKS